MTPNRVLFKANQRGITLEASGEKIVFRGPKGAMTEDLIAEIEAVKPGLIKLILRSERLGTCLGCECEFATYRVWDNGVLCLYCKKQRRALIDMQECPDGQWRKDKKGCPLPDKGDRF
jgi:hypothetical protein